MIITNMKKIQTEIEREYYDKYIDLIDRVQKIYIRCPKCGNIIFITEDIKDTVYDYLNGNIHSIRKFCKNCKNVNYLKFIYYQDSEFCDIRDINEITLENYFEFPIVCEY